MTDWNLAVRLTGQGSDLKGTLRDSAQEARKLTNRINEAKQALAELRAAAADNITVRLDIDADHLRADVQNALTAAGNGQGITTRLDIDGAHLRDDVNAALTTAGAGQGLGIRLALTDTMQLRRDVSDAVRWAAWGHRITIPIGLADPMQLRRDVSDAVRWASMNQTVRVRVVPDTSGLRNLTGAPGGGSGGGRGGASGLAGFLPIATAAIPLAGGLTASLAPLAGVLAAAAGGATVFGIALAGQIGPLSEAAEAEKAYQDAIQEHGRSSAEAAEAQLAYQRKLAAMPVETQKAAIALSGLKTDFRDWSDELSGFTMGPVTKAFTILQELLPSLSPEVRSFSGELDRLMNVAGGAVSTPGFDSFSDKVADLTDQKLDSFTDQVIHLLRVVSEGDADAGAIGQILGYMEQNGPAARAAMDSLGDAVSTLLEGASEAGPTMLTLVSAVAGLVGALPPELIGILLQVAAGLKLVQLAAAGSAAAAAAVTRLSASVQLLGARSAAAGGGLAGLRAAIAGLSTGAKLGMAAVGVGALALALHELSDNKPAVGVDELSTSLNTLVKTGEVTGALKGNFTEMSQSIAMVSKEASDNKLAQWTSDFGTWIGISTGPGISTAKKNLDAWDKAMAANVKAGHPKEAAAQWEILKKAWTAGGGSVTRLKEFTTDYSDALADSAFEQKMAAESMGMFGAAALQTSAQLDAQKGAADGLRASIIALNDANRSAYDAQIGFEQALDDLSAAFEKNGATLDIHTEAGRKNGQAMSTAAKAQDEMIASGLAAGDSFSSMTSRSAELRESMMKLATDAFDGNKKKAQEYVNTLLGTPKQVTTLIKAERADAIAGLEEVRSAIRATPGAKSVKVDTLNAAAIAALEAVGLKTKTLPDGRTQVYTANGQSLGSIGAVSSALNALNGKTAHTYTTHTIRTINEIITNSKTYRSVHDIVGKADGGIVDYYADGGIQRGGVQHFAGGKENHVAQIAPGGSWRVWGEPETQGEGYVPFAPSKRPRSRKITEEIVRRLGGDPGTIQWNADGNVTDWRYDPNTGSLYSASDAGSAGNKTKKVKVKGKTKEVAYFDIGAVEKKLKSAAKATQAWNKDLEKVADRVGGDVAEALASMGKEGEKLADKMANGSTKYINEMAAALRNLQKTAKASLTDYTRQLGTANKLNKTFSDNLANLAAQGYGDLAKQLAAQNDEAAQQLAAAAVKDKGKAASANAAAKTANNALTGDQIEQLVSIIAAVKTKTTGIHDVAATTELGEDEIIDTATKATSQIKNALGGRATRFLADLAKAQKGMAYANGGIRAGLYATRGGAVTFAEPSTGGEAYIPLGASKRRHAMPVLSDVASRFGVGLTDGNSGRVVIIREQGPLVGSQTWHVTSGGDAETVARRVDADNGYQLRRLKRGGVGARG